MMQVKRLIDGYRIAIVDDSATDAEFVQDILNRWADHRQMNIQAEVFSLAERFLFRYAEDKDWDILLLDIEMGAMDGVSLAKQIRQENDSVQIVFITGFGDYIAEGYEVSALHYLMKPVKQEKLFSVLDRAVTGIQKTERVILLPVGGEMLRLPVSRIQYVEAFSHTVTVVTTTDALQIKMPISEIERMLSDGFVRCHRSYLVGLKHIAVCPKRKSFWTAERCCLCPEVPHRWYIRLLFSITQVTKMKLFDRIFGKAIDRRIAAYQNDLIRGER